MRQPVRVQRSRTKGWKMPANTVYVGRPSKWGNPFPTATQFKDYCKWNQMKFPELKGKNLACWCPLDKPCHADVLLRIANES